METATIIGWVLLGVLGTTIAAALVSKGVLTAMKGPLEERIAAHYAKGFGLRQPAAAFVLAACCGALGLGVITGRCNVAPRASRLADESGSRLPQSKVLRTDAETGFRAVRLDDRVRNFSASPVCSHTEEGDMQVLVTGTSMFFTARLLQGFTSCGVSVTAADDHWWSIGKSMPKTRWLRTPSLSRNPGGYLSALIGELKARPYDLLLPTFEESLLLAEFREEVESLTTLLLPPFDVMWQLHHKPSLCNLCLDLEIPTPPTLTGPSPSDLEEKMIALRFPVVLKLPTGNNSIGREYCDTMPELVERFLTLYSRETHRHADPPFVQQKIDGETIYTLMLCHEGRKLGEVIYRPLRTFPENGGTSSHRESIHHPRIAELTERLAAATRWSGFLGLDFIVDRTDGTPYLIDANPRANPAVHLGYLGGVDWTGLLINVLQGRHPVPVTARPGVRNCTPLLDALWLIDGLRPRRNWASTLYQRFRKVLRPDWKLDSGHDFMGESEWIGHIAIGWQCFSAIGTSLLTGQALSQSFMHGANYDSLTVQPLRQVSMLSDCDRSHAAHSLEPGK